VDKKEDGLLKGKMRVHKEEDCWQRGSGWLRTQEKDELQKMKG